MAEKTGLDEGTVYNWFNCKRKQVRYGECLEKTQSIGEFVCLHSVLVSIKTWVNS